MSEKVQMTFIICSTLIAFFWILGKYFSDSNNKKK